MTLPATAPEREMSSRFANRVGVVTRALARRSRAREAPSAPRRILVAHHLLLGDTLMLTPLLKKLRTLHPRADIAMTVPRAIAPLYATRPYGVRALPFDPRRSASALYGEAPFDIAFVPGDNRYAWLAAAMRAHWIVAFDDDRPEVKSWPVDRLVSYPGRPGERPGPRRKEPGGVPHLAAGTGPGRRPERQPIDLQGAAGSADGGAGFRCRPDHH